MNPGGAHRKGPLVTAPNDYDYARSFLQFTTDRTNHTPRLQIDASLRVLEPGGTEKEYFLRTGCVRCPGNIAEETTSAHPPGRPRWGR